MAVHRPIICVSPIKSSEVGTLGRPKHIIHDKDLAEMVLIEQRDSGFPLGFDGGPSDVQPQHTVFLYDFYIDINLVSNRQFAQFVNESKHEVTSRWRTHYLDARYDDFPVRDITWHDADQYCKWAGKRLPSEAQWECAATMGGKSIVPWPQGIPSSRWADFCVACHPKATAPTYVGSRLPNDWGLYDVTGNVAQWIDDWYSPDLYRRRSRGETGEQRKGGVVINPRIEGGGSKRVVRGQPVGKSVNELLLYLRDSLDPDHSSPVIGLRTVWEVPPIETIPETRLTTG
jgi:formylglycine-generating enzyme required for sulfatase activity